MSNKGFSAMPRGYQLPLECGSVGVSGDGVLVILVSRGHGDQEKAARFAERACNSHDDLMAALEAHQALEKDCDYVNLCDRLDKALALGRAAIAKAKP